MEVVSKRILLALFILPRLDPGVSVREEQEQVFALGIFVADEERVVAPSVDQTLNLLNVVLCLRNASV